MGEYDFSIVMPCYNEEEGMPDTVMDVLDNVKGKYELIIVDDGSTDNTLELAREFEKKHSHIKVFLQQHNLGKRFAVDTGIKNASCDSIVLIDGDFTYPAKFINVIVDDFVEGFDMVYGSRFLGKKVNLSGSHKLGNKMFALIYNVLTFKRITDLTSGLRVFNRIRYFVLKLDSPNFGMETELMMKAFRHNWTFSEVPINLRKREGESKLSTFKDGFRILFRLFWNRFF
ncbi:MAG: glycosyltransferase family 2 protein [Nanoarchaeota archaeon]|nr:glycosyltransferase family 2 protein [Nanoarchaeota archaeon]